MDISLLSTFKEQLTTQYNEMVVSMLEQYKAELEDLNKMLLNVSTIIKEKESLVEELQAQVEDNKFNESNFNNVSIIQNLNKQIGDLTNQNEILATSLRIRKNTTPTEPVVVTEQKVELVVSEVVEEEVVEEVVSEVVSEVVTEVVTEVVSEVVNGEEGEEGEEDEGDEGEGEEEEVEVTEIEYKGKTYYVQNDVVYTKKKNGDMGKDVGVMKNGKPKLKKKDKKEN